MPLQFYLAAKVEPETDEWQRERSDGCRGGLRRMLLGGDLKRAP